MLSIIVPTYNEKENIKILADRVFKTLQINNIQGELIIVDDNSPDGTALEAQHLKQQYPIQVIKREKKAGLASAVMAGVKAAQYETICVMDADLSHPPEAIAEMYQAKKENDIVVGSRFINGGGTSDWNPWRKIISWIARIFSKLVTSIKDPTSGFFMFDKNLLEGAKINPIGYKILLEIIAKTKAKTIKEIPIIFSEREAGTSKMGIKEVLEFYWQLFLILINKPIFKLFLLLILTSFLFTFKIGTIPIIDGDSAFYGNVARNIVKTGDWLTLNTSVPGDIFDKPPLTFWINAACFKLFGINEFALGIWNSLFAVGIVFLTYLIAQIFFSSSIALLSSTILATSAVFFYQARLPMQDVALTFFITLAFYAFLLFDQKKKTFGLYLCSISCALALLTKGPVGLALPALAIFLYYLFGQRWKNYNSQTYWLHLPLSLVLFLIISAPWFIYEYQKLGPDFLNVFIGRNFGRYLKPVDINPNPQYDFYTYPLYLLLIMLPWSGFVYPALIYNFKKQRPQTLFLIIWALAVLGFFSFSLNVKIMRYVHPLMPALAILIALLLSYSKEKWVEIKNYIKVGITINLIIAIPLLIFILLIVSNQFKDIAPAYLKMFLPFLILYIGSLIIFHTLFILQKNMRIFIWGLLVSSFLSYTVLLISLEKYFDQAQPIKSFSLYLKEEQKSNDIVAYWGSFQNNHLTFYLGYLPLQIREEAEVINRLNKKSRIFILTENLENYKNLKQKYPRLKVLKQGPSMIIFSNQ